ncbi:MAG: hypothetical protein CM15mP73_0350 [Hyphomicrobiales bacterium]|nr:MAG: hypothetical protein CM15mP73_0350 [Hyphomicrobiales bacterium]
MFSQLILLAWDPTHPVLSSIDNEPCIIARGGPHDKGQLLTFLIALKYIKNEVGELPLFLENHSEGRGGGSKKANFLRIIRKVIRILHMFVIQECGAKILPQSQEAPRPSV